MRYLEVLNVLQERLKAEVAHVVAWCAVYCGGDNGPELTVGVV